MNGTDGGDGLDNPSAETRAKLSAALLGKSRSPEVREIAAINRYPEHREKLSMANTGKVFSQETRLKIRTARLGQSLSPEHRSKLSVAHLGMEMSKEHQEKLAESNHSLEKRAIHAAFLRGKPRSFETKEKISVALRKYHEKKNGLP